MKRNCKALKSEQFDVLIVGGGIYGAALCQEASGRGLKVALLEQSDFGSRTSGNSLKTIHGGLRYLQDFDLRLVRRMILARREWMAFAPHLVYPLPFVLPTSNSIKRHKRLFAAALPLVDAIGFDRNKGSNDDQKLPASQLWSAATIESYYQAGRWTGGASWHDAQIYSADRLIWFALRKAMTSGAVVANYTQAEAVQIQGGRVTGVRVTDLLRAETFNVAAKIVVDTTGIAGRRWAEVDSGQPDPTPSLAFNLVVRQFQGSLALGFPFSLVINGHEASGTLFAIPWQDRTLLGTVHLPLGECRGKVWPDRPVIAAVLEQVNQNCQGAELSPDDVDFIYRGILPADRKSAGLSLVRESQIIDHESRNGPTGLISVIGVKYTTALQSASTCVSLIVKKLGTSGVSQRALLADSFQTLVGQVADQVGHILHVVQIEHLVRCYGPDVNEIVDLIVQDPSLASPIGAYQATCAAQLNIAWRQEMALTVDSLANRLGLDFGGSVRDYAHCSQEEIERRNRLIGAIEKFLSSQADRSESGTIEIKSNG